MIVPDNVQCIYFIVTRNLGVKVRMVFTIIGRTNR